MTVDPRFAPSGAAMLVGDMIIPMAVLVVTALVIVLMTRKPRTGRTANKEESW